jgi:hypothetical protein
MGRLRRLEAYAARLSEETADSSLLAADANRSLLPPQPLKKPTPSPAGAAQKQRFPEKRTYDRSRDPHRVKAQADDGNNIDLPEPPSWRDFKSKEKPEGWDDRGAKLSDLKAFSNWLLKKPTVSSGASTYLSSAKSYLSAEKDLLVNQKDYNSVYTRLVAKGKAKRGTPDAAQALPLVATDFDALGQLDAAIFKLCTYLGVRSTNIKKFEPMAIVGDKIKFRVLKQTKKGVRHSGSILSFTDSAGAVNWFNAASDADKAKKVDELIAKVNKQRVGSEISENSFRVTCATMLRAELEKRDVPETSLFKLAKAASIHQGWTLPQPADYKNHSFMRYSQSFEYYKDLLSLPIEPIGHVVPTS